MHRLVIFGLLILLTSCKSSKNITATTADLILAFGSCNKHDLDNPFWDDILTLKPKVWIWGGDVVYADTYDMDVLKTTYNLQKAQKGYNELVNSIDVIGVWDDHDYGLNDGGIEYTKKAESQQLFLDFLDVPITDERRERDGIYSSKILSTSQGSVKLILLDTRYFRTELTPSNLANRRYEPNPYGKGTVLGEAQWSWLEQELSNSTANFNVILSSIQVLSNNHGYERWGTFPHERDKLLNTIQSSKAKGVVLLSGDRHVSEFSKLEPKGLPFPIIDFTSSGLTHSYESNPGELNELRVGELITKKSFGVLLFDFKTNTLKMQIRGDNNVVFQELTQSY